MRLLMHAGTSLAPALGAEEARVRRHQYIVGAPLVPWANQTLVDLPRTIAKRKSATPAPIALAWLLAQRPWIVPIPGTTKLERLEENAAAATLDLSANDLREIESAASRTTIEGARYPEQLEKRTGL
jgi:aryl-alcohol dehydrogenase-like predicted oxidoreductase